MLKPHPILICEYCGRRFEGRFRTQKCCSKKCRDELYNNNRRKGPRRHRGEEEAEQRKAAKRAFIVRREEEFRAHGGDTRTVSVVMVGGRRMVCETRR